MHDMRARSGKAGHNKPCLTYTNREGKMHAGWGASMWIDRHHLSDRDRAVMQGGPGVPGLMQHLQAAYALHAPTFMEGHSFPEHVSGQSMPFPPLHMVGQKGYDPMFNLPCTCT